MKLPDLLGHPKVITKAEYVRDSLLKKWLRENPIAYHQIKHKLFETLSANWWCDNRFKSLDEIIEMLQHKKIDDPVEQPSTFNDYFNGGDEFDSVTAVTTVDSGVDDNPCDTCTISCTKACKHFTTTEPEDF